METFRTLFGSLLALVYHCFDRIVVQGYLPLLTRPEHIVHFFRDVHGVAPITKEVLIQRTTEYKAWVEAFARDHGVPITWAEAGVKKEDHVRPYYERFARRRRAGALVRFLPPYSPDFNPIELAFAKLKAFLRAARPRNFDQVVALMAVAIDLFTPVVSQYSAEGTTALTRPVHRS